MDLCLSLITLDFLLNHKMKTSLKSLLLIFITQLVDFQREHISICFANIHYLESMELKMASIYPSITCYVQRCRL